MSTARRTVKRGSTREDAYLTALLSGHGFSEAAEIAGIGRTTGVRFRKSEAFQKRLQDGRHELLTVAIGKLHTDSALFEDTLRTIAGNPEARGSDRVLAARHGLDLLLRGVETLDMVNRIAKLEATVEEAHN